jgi:hypothetical protein
MKTRTTNHKHGGIALDNAPSFPGGMTTAERTRRTLDHIGTAAAAIAITLVTLVFLAIILF